MEKFCPWCNQAVDDRLCISERDSDKCRRKIVADVKAGRVSNSVAALALKFTRPERRHLRIIK